MHSLSVADVMHRPVITVADEATLADALNTMLHNKISALVVVDHSGHMVGVLSQTDLLRAWQEQSNFVSLDKSIVANYMTRDVISCAPHRSLEYAMGILDQHQIRRLVVIETRDGGRFVTDRIKPVGILSQADIVRALLGGEKGGEDKAEP